MSRRRSTLSTTRVGIPILDDPRCDSQRSHRFLVPGVMQIFFISKCEGDWHEEYWLAWWLVVQSLPVTQTMHLRSSHRDCGPLRVKTTPMSLAGCYTHIVCIAFNNTREDDVIKCAIVSYMLSPARLLRNDIDPLVTCCELTWTSKIIYRRVFSSEGLYSTIQPISAPLWS